MGLWIDQHARIEQPKRIQGRLGRLEGSSSSSHFQCAGAPEPQPSEAGRPRRRAHNEILNDTTRGRRPHYYLQNFHYQSGGWMTDNSAELYDTQVEVLFNGSANAIRRQALPQLHEVFAGRDQRKLSLMDVGCGTGRFFDSVKQVWPRLPIFGIDMSEAYVKYAKGHLKHWSQIRLSVGKAETLPFPDQSQDAVTSIFVFHELPPKVRRTLFDRDTRHKASAEAIGLPALQGNSIVGLPQ